MLFQIGQVRCSILRGKRIVEDSERKVIEKLIGARPKASRSDCFKRNDGGLGIAPTEDAGLATKQVGGHVVPVEKA